MAQVDNELAGNGNVDVWEVDRIVGAYRLGDGSCRYAVVWTVEEEDGDTWATAEELGLEEPHIGSGAGNDTFWHRRFGTGIQANQSLLVQWEIENGQPLPGGGVPSGNSQAQAPWYLGYNYWAIQQQCFGQFTVLGVQKARRAQASACEDTRHRMNMWTLEAERDSSNATRLSYSLGSSGGRFALKSWVPREFVGYKFISKNSHLGLDIKTR